MKESNLHFLRVKENRYHYNNPAKMNPVVKLDSAFEFMNLYSTDFVSPQLVQKDMNSSALLDHENIWLNENQIFL
jgi:hypothetical protein